MADYEQMELDIRLDCERDLKDNITNVITFAYESQNLEAEKAGREVKTVGITDLRLSVHISEFFQLFRSRQ